MLILQADCVPSGGSSPIPEVKGTRSCASHVSTRERLRVRIAHPFAFIVAIRLYGRRLLPLRHILLECIGLSRRIFFLFVSSSFSMKLAAGAGASVLRRST